MSNELDLLMDRDPLLLSAQDIDQIIAYQRKARAAFESGVKPKRETGPKQSLSAVMEALVPEIAPPTIRRRI